LSKPFKFPAFAIVLLLSTLLLLGCTDGDLVIPPTEQIIMSLAPDINVTLFNSGDYNGLCLQADNNHLAFGSCADTNAVLDWDNIFNFPVGCGANQAVQVVDTTLTCIDLIPDTNVWTEGYMDVNNVWVQDFEIAGDIMPAATLSYDIGSGAKRWLNLFVSQISSDDIVNSGDVNSAYFYGDGSNLTGISTLDTNCAIDGSCENVAYMDYNNIGTMIVDKMKTTDGTLGTNQLVDIYGDIDIENSVESAGSQIFEPALRVGGNYDYSTMFSSAVGLTNNDGCKY